MFTHNHRNSVFNNSCLKVPKNPKSGYPSPVYDRKFLNEVQNESVKTNTMKTKLKSNRSTPDKETTKSLIEFYRSIPEYGELNHLSNWEFYQHLHCLKEQQRTIKQCLETESKFDKKDVEWIEDYKNLKIGDRKIDNNKKSKSKLKSFCTTPILNKSSSSVNKNFDDIDCFSLSEPVNKPPSRRSVRIETPSEKSLMNYNENPTPETPLFRPKSRINLSSASSKGNLNDWDDFSFEDLNLDLEENNSLPSETKSAPTSPKKAEREVVTIPKPFQMTVRDEENKIVDELYNKYKKPKEEKSEQFKAHKVPIESQIPLFNKLRAEQEKKNFLVREKRKADLQSQMRPFSFTRRDEEIQALNKYLSKSTPSLSTEDAPIKIKKFKAKPVPKNLFSNYVYRKMHEDEFYRTLQKKIRAEEMLRAASLPPSMAKRERTKRTFTICPRSFRNFPTSEKRTSSARSKRLPNYRELHEKLELELNDLKNDFISTSPRPFKLRTSSRKIHSMHEPSTRTASSMEFENLNRTNLAAVLRIQSARNRLELDMCRKLEEAKLKEEMRWREKLMRKKPVWDALGYSSQEDIAMRLQVRRDEERLRNEEFRFKMQQMFGRVDRQPTLFERQSQSQVENAGSEVYLKSSPRRRSFSDFSDLKGMVRDEAVQVPSKPKEESLNGETKEADDENDEEKSLNDAF